MNKKNFLNLLKEKQAWRNDKLLINIVYFLQANRLVKIEDIEDFNEIYDNLEINNEIISSDNVSEYDLSYIKEKFNIRFTVNTIKEKINQGQILLLNFYTNLEYGRKQDRTHLVDCKIWFNQELNPLGL
jgi:hypothetical protein